MASDSESMASLEVEAVLVAGAAVVKRHRATNVAEALSALAASAREPTEPLVVHAVREAQRASEARDDRADRATRPDGCSVDIHVHGGDAKQVASLEATVRQAVRIAVDAGAEGGHKNEPLADDKIVWAHVYLGQLEISESLVGTPNSAARTIADAAVRDLVKNEALEAAAALLIA